MNPEARRLHLVHCQGCDECREWRDRPTLETPEEWRARLLSVNLSPKATPTRKRGE